MINTLMFYQNEDGGFGHSLEPDAWNPNSSPIQTWAATEILREVNFSDSSHPLVTGILVYLASGRHFSGRHWYSTIPSNNHYPHAPWWRAGSDHKTPVDYNPTAALAGFIIKYGDKNSALYAQGCRIAQEAVRTYLEGELLESMHTVSCYIRLMQYIEEAGAADIIDFAALQAKLINKLPTASPRILTSGVILMYAGHPTFSCPQIVFSIQPTRKLLIWNVSLLLTLS